MYFDTTKTNFTSVSEKDETEEVWIRHSDLSMGLKMLLLYLTITYIMHDGHRQEE